MKPAPESNPSRCRSFRFAASAAASFAALLLSAAPTAHAAPTLPAGTVAYWSFDSVLTDGSGNSNTLKGAAGTVQYGTAKFGSDSLYVDGSTTLGTLSGSFPTGVPTGNNAYRWSAMRSPSPSPARVRPVMPRA